jgi:hypothetical protein
MDITATKMKQAQDNVAKHVEGLHKEWGTWTQRGNNG